MTDPNRFTIEQARDPQTPDWLLADIAALRPDLQAVVARNPSASEKLLVWLGELGDSQVDDALAARAGGSQTTPRRPPAGSRPTATRPSAPGSSGAFWTASQPAVSASTAHQPTAYRPTAHQPTAYQPTAHQPTAYQPTAHQPTAYRPTAPQPPTPQWAGQRPPAQSAWPSANPYSMPGPVPGGAPRTLRYGAGGPTGDASGVARRLVLGILVAVLLPIVLLLAAVISAASRSDDFTRSTDSPNAYGDDASLDALWDACAAGDVAACDDLYWESPVGSAYEAFGRSCGGRDPDVMGGLCEDTTG